MLFVFNHAGSLLLCGHLSSCSERGWGLHSSCGAQASHCGGFSCCRAQALGQAGFSLQSIDSIAVAHGLGCSSACGIFPDEGSNPPLLHWQVSYLPLSHQGSPSVAFWCSISLLVKRDLGYTRGSHSSSQKPTLHVGSSEGDSTPPTEACNWGQLKARSLSNPSPRSHPLSQGPGAGLADKGLLWGPFSGGLKDCVLWLHLLAGFLPHTDLQTHTTLPSFELKEQLLFSWARTYGISVFIELNFKNLWN